MVSTSTRDAHPQSHPIPESQPNSCTEDFEASDEEAGCASDDDNFMDVGENSDTEVRASEPVLCETRLAHAEKEDMFAVYGRRFDVSAIRKAVSTGNNFASRSLSSACA